MARTTRTLTNTEVKQAKPKPKEYNLADGRGLALRIKPSGSKYWIFNYSRPFTKKRANISFGAFPALSLADARIKREEALKLLASDIDPRDHKAEIALSQRAAHENTLKSVATQWLEVKKKTISADHADKIWSSLKLHIFPTLGDAAIHKITAPLTIDTLRPVSAKGSLETVKRLCQRLNEIMVFSLNTGIIQSNLLAGIGAAFAPPEKQNLPTLKPDQLPDLMVKLTTASIKLTTRCLIEWQLHTMVRPSEAAGTRWEEIENDTWLIPGERMKSGRPHTVPLSPQAISLLELMKQISEGREFVFPADRNPNNHCNAQTANMALKRMGYKGTLVAHGLRALASTTLNEHGFDPDVVESALAHVDSNEVRRAYNRAEYLERRKVVMCWWSAHIEAAATGNMSLATKHGITNIRPHS